MKQKKSHLHNRLKIVAIMKPHIQESLDLTLGHLSSGSIHYLDSFGQGSIWKNHCELVTEGTMFPRKSLLCAEQTKKKYHTFSEIIHIRTAISGNQNDNIFLQLKMYTIFNFRFARLAVLLMALISMLYNIPHFFELTTIDCINESRNNTLSVQICPTGMIILSFVRGFFKSFFLSFSFIFYLQSDHFRARFLLLHLKYHTFSEILHVRNYFREPKGQYLFAAKNLHYI